MQKEETRCDVEEIGCLEETRSDMKEEIRCDVEGTDYIVVYIP